MKFDTWELGDTIIKSNVAIGLVEVGDEIDTVG